MIIHTGGVKGEEEISETVVYELFQIKDKLTDCSWYFSRVIPPENMNDGALVNGMIRVNYLRTRKPEEGVDGNKNDTNGVVVNGTLSGSTSRELKDALDIQGGGLEQHWVFGSRVSWIWKPDHSCMTRAEREYPNRVGVRRKGDL